MSIPALSSTLTIVRTMDCSCAQRALYLEREGLQPEELRALEVHLEQCSECREAAENAARLRTLLKRPTLRRSAPETLRLRIQRSFHHRRVVSKN